MAFSDPSTITVNSVAKSMPRVETDGRKAIYQSADGLWTLTVSHRSTKNKGRERVSSVIRVDQKKLVTDPITSVTDYDTLSQWFVIDRPFVGFTVTEVQQQVAGFAAGFLDSTTIAKIFGQES